MNSETLYFVAGEASGDEHGAALMHALREAKQDLHFRGRGGPRMKAIGGTQFIDWIDEAGVVGLWEVIRHYGYFRRQFRAALAEIDTTRPKAVILIDYPGFNLRLARTLRRRSPRPKILYYIAASVGWHRTAIARWRARIDIMLCIFFRAELSNQSGCARYLSAIPCQTRRGRQLYARATQFGGTLSGSRFAKSKNPPIMIAAACENPMRNVRVPDSKWRASEALARKVSGFYFNLSSENKVRVGVGERAAIMQRACIGILLRARPHGAANSDCRSSRLQGFLDFLCGALS